MALDRRARVLVVVGLVAVVVAAFLVLGRERDPVPEPVTELDESGVMIAPVGPAFAAPDVTNPTDVVIARVCAPTGTRLQLVGVEPVGGSGEVKVVDFGPQVVTADCAADEPLALTVDVLRMGGEAASVDGFVVTYEVDGTEESKRIERPITLCRQLSEC